MHIALVFSKNVLTCLSEVLEAHFVHRKEAYSGTILGTHVGDCSSVSNGQLRDTWTIEFNKLPHNTDLTQMLLNRYIYIHCLSIIPSMHRCHSTVKQYIHNYLYWYCSTHSEIQIIANCNVARWHHNMDTRLYSLIPMVSREN